MLGLKTGLNAFHLYGNLLEGCVSRHQALSKSISTLFFFAYFGLIFALLTHFPHRSLILICNPPESSHHYMRVRVCACEGVCVCA